jgi:hypothetical protein
MIAGFFLVGPQRLTISAMERGFLLHRWVCYTPDSQRISIRALGKVPPLVDGGHRVFVAYGAEV